VLRLEEAQMVSALFRVSHRKRLWNISSKRETSFLMRRSQTRLNILLIKKKMLQSIMISTSSKLRMQRKSNLKISGKGLRKTGGALLKCF
jgi:hypothetical protein